MSYIEKRWLKIVEQIASAKGLNNLFMIDFIHVQILNTKIMNYLQLIDTEGENFALIKTNIDRNTCESMLENYWHGEISEEDQKEIGYNHQDINPEGFIKYLHFKGFKCKRLFFDEVRA